MCGMTKAYHQIVTHHIHGIQFVVSDPYSTMMEASFVYRRYSTVDTCISRIGRENHAALLCRKRRHRSRIREYYSLGDEIFEGQPDE